MFDNAQRSMWLEQAYLAICKEYQFAPQNLLVNVSYPPSGARGDLSRVRPASLDRQWHGNGNEKDGFLAIHPIAFRSPLDAMKAILWGLAKERSRRYDRFVGLHKLPDATIEANPETTATLERILTEVGNPPDGFGDPFAVKPSNRGRMIAYSCDCVTTRKRNLTVHCATTALDATCNTCGTKFKQI